MWKFQIGLVSIFFCQIRSEYVDFLTKSKTCPNENMIFYPLDENSTTWICDCIEKYLYFPETDSCYQPYKQGPCLPGNYLVLSRQENFGKCEENPCLEDGLVPFKGGCHLLGQFGPHCNKNNITGLFVSPDFKLTCSLPVFFGIINAPRKVCPIGSRRMSIGICKQIFN